MAAAATLIEILTTNMAPPNFSRVLLIDAIPLLEASIEVDGAEDGTLLPVLSRDDTYEILRCLEEFCLSTAACTGVVRRQDGDVHLEPFVDILRLACARNLARTMMVADEQDGELDVTE